jgi:hypothetical protein
MPFLPLYTLIPGSPKEVKTKTQTTTWAQARANEEIIDDISDTKLEKRSCPERMSIDDCDMTYSLRQFQRDLNNYLVEYIADVGEIIQDTIRTILKSREAQSGRSEVDSKNKS